MYKHILVATDGSKLSLKAVRTAASLAASLGARLSGFYVMPAYVAPLYAEAAMYVPAMSPKAFAAAMQKEALAALSSATKAADEADVVLHCLKTTDAQPWSAIIKAARARKCDLIVMASHGRRGWSALLLGSETTKVLTHSKVPVLVVR